MQNRIESIDEFIKDTGIITNYGGFCINRQPETGQKFPYGVAPIVKGQTNMYSYSDNHLCSGYSYLANLRNGGRTKNGLLVTIGINIFTNILKQGNKIPHYQRPVALYGLLSKLTGVEDIRLITPNLNYFQEWATIEIDFIDYAPCSFEDDAVKICLNC
jgi:hypothetical protein